MRGVMLCSVLVLLFIATSAPAETWRFAVSGDSRNCGDLVMPAIAAGVKSDRAAFYWHLGDFRRLSKIDEDMHVTSFDEYRRVAWSDFIDHQLQAFAPVPVYLAIGNHELNDRTRSEFLAQFAKWFPEHRTYYDWRTGSTSSRWTMRRRTCSTTSRSRGSSASW
jgi:hypothetical protein